MTTSANAGQDSPAARLGELATAAWGCGRELRRMIADRLAADGIDDEAFLALALLDKAPEGVVQGDLAASLAVSPAQTSGLVERLRKQGWCESRRDANDRRRQRWVLTETGREVLNRCQRTLSGQAETLLAEVAAGDLAQATGVLARLSSLAAKISSASSSTRAVA